MGQYIGYGSYERANREQSKEDLRNRFLKAVNNYARHVLDDLYGEPFRLYLEAGLGFNEDVYSDDLDSYERAIKRESGWTRHLCNRPEWPRKFERGPIAYNIRKESFRQSLFEWSRRNGLDADWCRESAYNTLDIWAYSRPDSEHSRFQPLVKVITFFQIGRPEKWFELPEGIYLHPQLYPLEAIEAELQRRVRAYINDVKVRLEANKFVPTPEEYKTKKHDSKLRFRWLVERVIYHKPYQTILDELGPEYEHGLEYSTLRKTIVNLAKYIGLPLPPMRH